MDKENLIRNNQPPPYESTAYTQPHQPPQVHPTYPGGQMEGYQRPPIPQQQLPPGYNPQYPGGLAQPAFLAQRKIIHGGIWCLTITSICCCVILGIVALVFALSANDKEKRQDFQEAMRLARLVKIFATLAIIIGVVLWILSLVFGILGAAL